MLIDGKMVFSGRKCQTVEWQYDAILEVISAQFGLIFNRLRSSRCNPFNKSQHFESNKYKFYKILTSTENYHFPWAYF